MAPDSAAAFNSFRLEFEGKERWAEVARVHVPRHLDPTKKWPVAVLLHGYAQGSSVERAIAAWRAEYGVLDAYRRLRNPALLLDTKAPSLPRAREIVDGLKRKPFQGVILVCPVVPIPYFQSHLSATYAAYADFLSDILLPRVASIAPACIDPDSVGLGGFSMGGLVGLELMWRFPERFCTLSGVQTAVSRRNAYRYAWRLERAWRADPALADQRSILLLTAREDRYRWANRALYEALKRKELQASFALHSGRHTSRWMRREGSIETLLWLDRTLQHRG